MIIKRLGWALMGIPWIRSTKCPWYYMLGARIYQWQDARDEHNGKL